MKTKETLQLLHNIHDYTFSHFSEQFSTRLVVYKLKHEFVWNNISCRIYYNNVKYHSKEVAQWCSVKKMFLKFRKIHWKTPMSESLFY